MSTFEENLEKYYEKLRNNPEYVQVLFKKKNSPKGYQIIFGPRTPEELFVADNISSLFIEVLDMNKKIYGLSIPEFEEVEYYSYLVDLMKAMKENNNDEITRINLTINSLSPEENADLFFDSTLVLLDDPYGVSDKVQELTGLTDDEFDYYFEEARSMINTFGIFDVNLAEKIDDLSTLEKISSFSCRFDSRYQSMFNKIQTNQKQKTDDK